MVKVKAIWPVIATMLLLITGCASIDSVDPTSDSFPVTFRNDTGRNVHLKLCADSQCHSFDYSDSWTVGQSAQENIGADGFLVRWLVQDDASKAVLGCILLEFNHKVSNVVIPLSRAVSCPGRRPLRVN